MAERLELLKTDLASRSEAIRLNEENDRMMDEIIANDKAERAETLNTRLLEAEDLLLKGKSEKQKAGFRLGVNLMNAEKRENANKIVSSTYTAAMDAYKALAGIPYSWPSIRRGGICCGYGYRLTGGYTVALRQGARRSG
jgi:hypothetical protein